MQMRSGASRKTDRLEVLKRAREEEEKTGRTLKLPSGNFFVSRRVREGRRRGLRTS